MLITVEEHIQFIRKEFKEGNIPKKLYDKIMYLLENKKFIEGYEKIRQDYQIPSTEKEINTIKDLYEGIAVYVSPDGEDGTLEQYEKY